MAPTGGFELPVISQLSIAEEGTKLNFKWEHSDPDSSILEYKIMF